MEQPALPWANPSTEKETTHEELSKGETSPVEQANEKFITLETAGVFVGDRVEVKWQIEADDAEPYMRWWGATIVGPSSQVDTERPGAPVYELAYDAHDGFEPEHSHVIFTSEHSLRQLDQTEELAWRCEGDDWDEEQEDEDAEAAEGPDGEAVVTMQELRQIVAQEREYLGGKTLEEAESEVLSSLEPSKRIAVAAGFRDFADNWVSFLHTQVANSEGGQLTVTEDHVKAFMENFKKRQRTA